MTNKDVTLIDYGLSNIQNVKRAFEYCGAKVLVTSNYKEIMKSKKIVLPGVGAFKDGMNALKNLGLISVIREAAQSNIHLMGICLGMQLLFDESEEFGLNQGLGIIPGKVERIPTTDILGCQLKSPNIGWREIEFEPQIVSWNTASIYDVNSKKSFYFVHSFMARPANQKNKIANCDYCGQKITAIVEQGNVIGFQFHPEKSGKAGLEILNNFIAINGIN